jgi:hypothetical protein
MIIKTNSLAIPLYLAPPTLNTLTATRAIQPNIIIIVSAYIINHKRSGSFDNKYGIYHIYIIKLAIGPLTISSPFSSVLQNARTFLNNC